MFLYLVSLVTAILALAKSNGYVAVVETAPAKEPAIKLRSGFFRLKDDQTIKISDLYLNLID